MFLRLKLNKKKNLRNMINVGKKVSRLILISLLCLVVILLWGQDPPKKETKKQKKQREHIQTSDTVAMIERVPDSLYIQQLDVNAQLDSLIKEQNRK